MHAAPMLIVILCLLAIAYRYYSAFLAARVVMLNDNHATPAERLADGQNYHPTSKWVLFGHHFAAISGAGPLIGPVLAAQFGYMPGLLWIVIGVCLAGAVQDFLVLAISTQRNGTSLAQIAYDELGRIAGTAAMAAILFIIVISLAGLGAVVVKALGGERVPLPPGMLMLPANQPTAEKLPNGDLRVPGGSTLIWSKGTAQQTFDEPFTVRLSEGVLKTRPPTPGVIYLDGAVARIVPGSPWGTFTIVCTIPIALFVGLYMYRLRKGRVIEASLIGGALTLAATVAGGWVARSSIAAAFNWTGNEVIFAMAIYGFVASVLPVWLLLAPRDYLSSFLKIGTLALLVIGVIVANPKMAAPAFNHVFFSGGPVVPGRIFPFLFITIMCGAISGFHSLVSSGTTPKMIAKESDARVIGYGAMLVEGLVGVIAMIAASSLAPADYYAMNVSLDAVPAYHVKLVQIGSDLDHLNEYDMKTQESLRGRTGGAVTLAVGMASIFQNATQRFFTVGNSAVNAMWAYWYHFAIMFEALFILTTIDAGTRIGRFLLQEVFGKISPALGRHDWLPGTILSSALIVSGWAYMITANSFSAIWAMFGVANQMLAVIALAVVTVTLAQRGKIKYLLVTAAPMTLVATTTTTAAIEKLQGYYLTLSTQFAKTAPDGGVVTNSLIGAGLIIGMLVCTYTILTIGGIKIWPLLIGQEEPVVPLAVTSWRLR